MADMTLSTAANRSPSGGGEPFAVGVDKRDLCEVEPSLKVKERAHENRDSCSTSTNDADFHRCLQ